MAPDEPPQKLEKEAPTREELLGTPSAPQMMRSKKKGPSATSTPFDKDMLQPSHSQRLETGVKNTASFFK